MKDAKVCPKGTFAVNNTCRPVPYADKVHFYADTKNKTIVTARTKYVGKGWHDVRVGNHHEKVRRGEGSAKYRLLNAYYPTHKDDVSLFSELSYHSSIGQNEVGKVTNYGTSDYTKDFSVYKKIARFKLLQPVKTQVKKDFGKEVNAVTVHKWRYVAIDWRPNKKGDVTLFVEDKIKDPITGKDKTLFVSKEIPLSNKQEAFRLFDKRVAEAKKW